MRSTPVIDFVLFFCLIAAMLLDKGFAAGLLGLVTGWYLSRSDTV
jgi:hypothetical protein